ncbi:MAG: hypothetical protein WDZ80_07935, partial [Candidatus Paceibacterota bacterium]
GVQLFGTMFTDINRKTLQLNTLHLIFKNVFPDIGIIEQIANSYGKEKFEIAPYASTFHDQMCTIFNIESTSPIDWIQIPPILIHAIGVVTPNINESLQAKS